MDEPTRVRIRHLYFVERMAVPAIAEALALAPHAVRSALVLPGGRVDCRTPEPVAAALAPTPNSRPPVAASRRRAPWRHR